MRNSDSSGGRPRACLSVGARDLARRIVLSFLSVAVLASDTVQAQPGSETFDRAQALVRAEDWESAERFLLQALVESEVFVPEKEIEFESTKQVLLDTMIQDATRAYRLRRASYFELLGLTLERSRRWAEARKAFQKAFFLAPSFALLESIASQPDLSPRDRYEYRVEGMRLFRDVGEQQTLEQKLIDSGAFLNRWALQASLDARRIEGITANPAYRFELARFPSVRATTDAGTLASTERLDAGHVLMFYFPESGCVDCTEDLDDIGRSLEPFRKSEKMIDLAVFVPERELAAIRRIVRLLAMDIEVGRVEGLPASLRQTEAELWLVARGGLSWLRRDLKGNDDEGRMRGTLGREVERILDYFDETGLPTEDDVASYRDPLVSLPSADRSWKDWLAALDRLEIGPLVPEQGYRALAQKLRADLRDNSGDPDAIRGFLKDLSRLQYAGDAKSFLLSRLQPRILETLLDRARELVPAVRRASDPSAAPMFVAVSEESQAPGYIVVQKAFATGTGEHHHIDFLLAPTADGLEIGWAAASLHQARGSSASATGAIFHHQREDGCQGVRLVSWAGEGDVYEGCPAVLIAGSPREVRAALADDSDVRKAAGEQATTRSLPVYYAGVSAGSESTLETALTAYQAGDYRAAEQAFERAMEDVDPAAPYDRSDLRYNRARAVEASGDLQRALELYRQIGDVSYQDWIVTRMRAIEDPSRQRR